MMKSKLRRIVRKDEEKKLREYSKRVIRIMIILWFVTALFGMGVITYQLFMSPEYVNLDGLYEYVGYPMTGGIIGYLIKSAVENKQKIKNAPYAEREEEEI